MKCGKLGPKMTCPNCGSPSTEAFGGYCGRHYEIHSEVAAERRACAEIADQCWEYDHGKVSGLIARRIRERPPIVYRMLVQSSVPSEVK